MTRPLCLLQVHRRTEGNEIDIVLRFEAVRRREAERFRHVSTQTNAFLQDLAAAVGYSDYDWSVPPCTAAVEAVVRRQPVGAAARRTTGISSRGRSVLVPPLQASPLLPPTRQGSERCRAAPTSAVARSCPVAIQASVTSTETHTTHSPEVVKAEEGTPKRQPRSVGLDRSDLAGDQETRETRRDLAARIDTVDQPPRLQTAWESDGGDARESEISSGLPVMDLGQDHRAEFPEQKGPGNCLSIVGPVGPSALTSRISSAPLAPSEFGAVTHVAEAGIPAAATDQPTTTTMASAAKVLLAREEQGRKRSGSLEPPHPLAAAKQVSSLKQTMAARCSGERSKAEVIAHEIGSRDLLGRTRNENKGRVARAANKDGPNGRESPPHLEQTRVRGSSVRNERSTDPGRVSPDAGSAIRPASSAGVCVTAAAAAVAADGLCPTAGQQHICIPRQEGVVRVVDGIGSSVAGPKDEDGGGTVASGATAAEGRRGSSSEATRRLLREALRVKRRLAAMDRADGAASTADNGLGDEDPERFIASLGLAELKPLSARLVEALDRPPQALLGDSSVAVPEPRTTRGLRDQVCRLCVDSTLAPCVMLRNKCKNMCRVWIPRQVLSVKSHPGQ